MAVFLDYDGTLTPIVRDPDAAFMSQDMRDAVRRVSELFPSAIISGRGREKVEQFVQLGGLFYAGSHGMDIVGPALITTAQSHEHASEANGASSGATANSAGQHHAGFVFQPAAHFEPLMNDIHDQLLDGESGWNSGTVQGGEMAQLGSRFACHTVLPPTAGHT